MRIIIKDERRLLNYTNERNGQFHGGISNRHTNTHRQLKTSKQKVFNNYDEINNKMLINLLSTCLYETRNKDIHIYKRNLFRDYNIINWNIN